MAQNVVPPPVPTREPIGDPKTLLVTRPWIAFFNDLISLILSFLVIESNGVALPQEKGLNFTSPLTAVDNPGNETIDIGLDLAATTTPDGTYLEFPDGTLIEWGQSGAAAATGASAVTVNVTFPKPFTTPPVVTCGPDNRPDNTGNFPFVCYPSNITTTGFMANFSCPILIGGFGASGIHNVIHCDWTAMGL